MSHQTLLIYFPQVHVFNHATKFTIKKWNFESFIAFSYIKGLNSTLIFIKLLNQIFIKRKTKKKTKQELKKVFEKTNQKFWKKSFLDILQSRCY